jgi:hypothetical protein
MWRNGEMIDEGGKWFKVSCGKSLYLGGSFRASRHFQISLCWMHILGIPKSRRSRDCSPEKYQFSLGR